MSTSPVGKNIDAVVIGAGPVGCVTAIAHARKGYKVLLLEANPESASRLAGEWLHPPALSVLKLLNIPIPEGTRDYPNGRGFAVFPGDGTESVILPYDPAKPGLSIEHKFLVEHLRLIAVENESIHYIPYARVKDIQDHEVYYSNSITKQDYVIESNRIIGADGKNSLIRSIAKLDLPSISASRIAAVQVHGANLPIEGYGHVFLGGPGPLLAYRINADTVRLVIDLPLYLTSQEERMAYLWEAYSPLIPGNLNQAFSEALLACDVIHAVNRISPRKSYGSGDYYMVGDAVGYYHPLTAVGMTLGFKDAICLAESEDINEYSLKRRKDCRVPELLSEGLYDVFAGSSYENVLVRKAIFRLWRSSAVECKHSMQLLACANTNYYRFLIPFARTLFDASFQLIKDSFRHTQWQHSLKCCKRMINRSLRLISGDVLGFIKSRNVSSGVISKANLNPESTVARDIMNSIERARKFLISKQSEQGGWEGEMIWCPMIAAQFVITWTILDIEITESRRILLIRHFENTCLDNGLWGLHEHAESSLYVTALVYVASRILGVESEHNMLRSAKEFIRKEDITSIPTWGKFWLSMLGIYHWQGVSPVPPELWTLPEYLQFHPSKFYCHTRLIYLSMSVIYARRFISSKYDLAKSLIDELYVEDYEKINWKKKINYLRKADLYKPVNLLLRIMRYGLVQYEKFVNQEKRQNLIDELSKKIRWELQTTNHTSISPVSGLLNIIALKILDSNDVDAKQAINNFNGWIWQDEQYGLRVTGARSISWDTAFALQTLAVAETDSQCQMSLNNGTRFLAEQQIKKTFPGYSENFRIDPRGGWCFAGQWHGWPVSDCTAEAVSAIVAAGYGNRYRKEIHEGINFILKCQNKDGGFGSYEPRHSLLSLEPLNPAEMFANSMSENSYIECTSSCITALRDAKSYCPEELSIKIDEAILRGVNKLLSAQHADGSYEGAWGVYFIYGTFFAIRGLLAGGLPASHPAIREACHWLLSCQHQDGSFGESHRSAITHSYVELEKGQVIQTAWALIALLEAKDPNWACITAAAEYLRNNQLSDGNWPRENMAGIFFHTALLHYDLYRSYFPLLGLALYEARHIEHEIFNGHGFKNQQISSEAG